MLQQEISRNADASHAEPIDRATGLHALALGDVFATVVAAVRHSYRRQVARRRAHLAALELSRFDDLKLRDIGVERADISKLTRGLVDRADDVGNRSGVRKALRPTPAIAESGPRPRQDQPLACCG